MFARKNKPLGKFTTVRLSLFGFSSNSLSLRSGVASMHSIRRDINYQIEVKLFFVFLKKKEANLKCSNWFWKRLLPEEKSTHAAPRFHLAGISTLHFSRRGLDPSARNKALWLAAISSTGCQERLRWQTLLGLNTLTETPGVSRRKSCLMFTGCIHYVVLQYSISATLTYDVKLSNMSAIVPIKSDHFNSVQ